MNRFVDRGRTLLLYIYFDVLTCRNVNGFYNAIAPFSFKNLTTTNCDVIYERGFSFFSFHNANNPTPETFTTLNRTPGISPLALPFRPKPEIKTSSFSSTKFYINRTITISIPYF